MDRDLQIRDAQYRKGLSIAFFNSTNNAIEILKLFPHLAAEKGYRTALAEIRSWLLDEHRDYYATVIAQVGTHYNAVETIALVQTAENTEMLRNIWLTLTEDERHDPVIIKVKDEVKAKLEAANGKADTKATKHEKKG